MEQDEAFPCVTDSTLQDFISLHFENGKQTNKQTNKQDFNFLFWKTYARY